MTPEEFIKVIREELVNDYNNAYQGSLIEYDSTGVDSREIIEKDVLLLYKKMSTDEKKVFISLLRSVSVDIVSGFLSILDGTAILDKYRENFNLTYSRGSELNGDLADIFWGVEEEEGYVN